MATLPEIVRYLDDHLSASRFHDAAINGLQVEGRREVARILVGVSACRELFDEAVSSGYDAILVHHGLFWDKPRPVVGLLARRLRVLLSEGISLIAYHLPLDAHPVDGNNARLADLLRVQDPKPWGEYRGQAIGCIGQVTEERTFQELIDDVNRLCQTKALVLGDQPSRVGRVAICSGGAGSLLDQAIADGADVFVTGEPGEPAQALARESGITVIGAGHHHTERFGVRALSRRLVAEFELETRFFDIPNPV